MFTQNINTNVVHAYIDSTCPGMTSHQQQNRGVNHAYNDSELVEHAYQDNVICDTQPQSKEVEICDCTTVIGGETVTNAIDCDNLTNVPLAIEDCKGRLFPLTQAIINGETLNAPFDFSGYQVGDMLTILATGDDIQCSGTIEHLIIEMPDCKDECNCKIVFFNTDTNEVIEYGCDTSQLETTGVGLEKCDGTILALHTQEPKPYILSSVEPQPGDTLVISWNEEIEFPEGCDNVDSLSVVIPDCNECQCELVLVNIETLEEIEITCDNVESNSYDVGIKSCDGTITIPNSGLTLNGVSFSSAEPLQSIIYPEFAGQTITIEYTGALGECDSLIPIKLAVPECEQCVCTFIIAGISNENELNCDTLANLGVSIRNCDGQPIEVNEIVVNGTTMPAPFDFSNFEVGQEIIIEAPAILDGCDTIEPITVTIPDCVVCPDNLIISAAANGNNPEIDFMVSDAAAMPIEWTLVQNTGCNSPLVNDSGSSSGVDNMVQVPEGACSNGDYTITVTDANGCTETFDFSVTIFEDIPCSQECDIDISQGGFGLTTPIEDIQAYITENHPGCGTDSNISYSFETGQEVRFLEYPTAGSGTAIPPQIKSIKLCGGTVSFEPPLSGAIGEDITDLINAQVPDTYSCVFESLIIGPDGFEYAVCGVGNAISAQIALESNNGGTIFLGWSTNPETVTKTRTFTIDEDCLLKEV